MRPLIKAIRILLAILVILLATWMTVFRMPLSALWGAALAWFLWPRASRTWRTAWIGLALGLLLPVFTLQVTLREFAHASDRASCAVRHAMDKPAAFCDGLRYRALTGTDSGPVLTLDQRLGVAGFNVLMALGGYLAGFPEVAGETLRLLGGDGEIAHQPVSARRRRCRAGAASGGPVVEGTSDFFLDSRLFRREAAAFARRARDAAPGTTLGQAAGVASMGGGGNTAVYFTGEKPMTSRTALALYVPGATISGVAVGDGAMDLTWEGGIFYPAGYAFEATIPTLTAPVTLRLDESLFCGLQLDGWMTPYTQRWTAHIDADDPRLASAMVTANAPGPFERAARWAQGGGR
ncbi:MAG: hypothetical protein ABIO70_27555 [Pseudomonadota bacterium]